MKSILDSPVPHLQTPWEWDAFIEYIVLPTNPERIVEIGSFFGATLWSFIQNSPRLKTILSLDLPIGPEDGRYQTMIESRAKWKDWSDKIVEVIGDSHSEEVRTKVYNKIRDVDILFIDGDHSRRGVEADYEMYKDLVRDGGVIAFHDSVGLPSVKSFTDTLEGFGKFIKINEAQGWGIFILIKK
jgi:predicted O-methyltransferase YrrM